MQNCNLARSLQFLHLDTRLTSVKYNCNGFNVITVVNLIKNSMYRVTSTRTTITNNEEAQGSILYCLNGQSMEIILDQFQLLLHMFCPHVFVVTNSYCCFFYNENEK